MWINKSIVGDKVKSSFVSQSKHTLVFLTFVTVFMERVQLSYMITKWKVVRAKVMLISHLFWTAYMHITVKIQQTKVKNKVKSSKINEINGMKSHLFSKTVYLLLNTFMRFGPL